MLFLIIDKTNNTHVSVLTLEVFVVVLFSFTRSKFVHCYTILFLLIKIPVILLGIGCVMHVLIVFLLHFLCLRTSSVWG